MACAADNYTGACMAAVAYALALIALQEMRVRPVLHFVFSFACVAFVTITYAPESILVWIVWSTAAVYGYRTRMRSGECARRPATPRKPADGASDRPLEDALVAADDPRPADRPDAPTDLSRFAEDAATPGRRTPDDSDDELPPPEEFVPPCLDDRTASASPDPASESE